MIFWQRWGILVLFCAGLGMGTGFLLNAVIEPRSLGSGGNPLFAGIGLVMAAVYSALLVHLVILPHLDKPRPVLRQEPLQQPIQGPHGLQTHRVHQVVDSATGRPLTYQPRSSLFFVPVRYWPFVLGAIGLIVIAVTAFTSLLF